MLNSSANKGAAGQAGLFPSAMNAVNSAASGAMAAVSNAASGAVVATVNAFENVANSVNKGMTAATNTMNKAVNAAAPAINSLIPFQNAAPAGAANNRPKNGASNDEGILQNLLAPPTNGRRNNNALTPPSVVNNILNAGKSAAASANGALNSMANAANAVAPAAPGGMMTPLNVFIALVALFLVVFAVFNEQIRKGYEYVVAEARRFMGLDATPDVVSQITPTTGEVMELTVPPTTLQDDGAAASIVEKVLPAMGGNEVFNVAQNNFTFYDAEPLCKALGAELASYEQVKDAWSKGADWCNYGWVKGQMAVYPTQKDTFDKLQGGPGEQKNACGTVGVNGGVFDNPELRFGVNCYGKKPSQTAHDEKQLMAQGRIPKTAAELEVDRRAAEFKDQADELFVKPFNDGKWSGGGY
jgi:hypothetical protein